jgi:hypothetical protein
MATDDQRPIADDQRLTAHQVKNKKMAREAKEKKATEVDERTFAYTPAPPMSSEQATIAKLAAIQKAARLERVVYQRTGFSRFNIDGCGRLAVKAGRGRDRGHWIPGVCLCR